MPEYLAPGVYVEETSFRSKSIEGVGTSTTGMVGPTLTGPIGETPELITSFGDFERIYGGLGDLSFGTNYLAHSARAFFNEGGSRLYISRVFQQQQGDEGFAASDPFVATGNAADEAGFVARFRGSAGNQNILVRQIESPATYFTMELARPGAMLRVGGAGLPATATRMTGNAGPFSVNDGDQLLLTVGGANSSITFRGRPAEVTSTAQIPDPIAVDNTNNTLVVTINGGPPQTIVIPDGNYTPNELAAAINSNNGIRGGYTRIQGGNLVIGTDRRGIGASVTVAVNQGLQFNPAQSQTNAADVNNNVDDLMRVTAADINTRLTAEGIAASASADPNSGDLILTTTATGAAAALDVRNGPNSVEAILGLTAGSAVAGVDGVTPSYYIKTGADWVDSNGANLAIPANPAATDAPAGGANILTLTVVPEGSGDSVTIYEDMGFDPNHPRYVGTILRGDPTSRREQLENRFAITIGGNVTPYQLRTTLFTGATVADDGMLQRTINVSNGNDGAEPNQARYEDALQQLERLEDISIVAGPGYSAYTDAAGIMGALISHASRRRAYRIAVLDTPPNFEVSDARTWRGGIDSTYAALYFPWVTVSNPLAQPGNERIPREINLPPSGFVCGIYARNDIQRGVHKAPANEVVRGALRFENEINFAEQEVLNPLGVNCLRYLSGRGYRVWGGRTASSDPEWKYVNVRRYFIYLEASIDRSTQWAVFEPNGERLWANIRETITGFLYNEWVSGALLGSSPQEAFFVRCDRSTMTQADLDNGRLICLIGVAALKPAEFVIFRIGQKTADARS